MSGSSGPYPVLLVEDDPDFAALAETFLERVEDRFTVETAADAAEGLERLDQGHYDCVVSDYDMPGRDGLAFLEALRAAGHDLPFVLYTGKGSEEIASRALSMGVTDYRQKQAGSEHFELLARSCLNAIEQHRAETHASDLDRIRRVIQDVNQALVRSDRLEDLDQRVCEIIADADPYRFAWIGSHDRAAERVVPRASAGLEAGYLEEIEITTGDAATSLGPTGRAVASHEIQVLQDLQDAPSYEPWEEAARERGYRSSAAVPLVYEGDLLGVLNVYAARRDAFDDAELELLAELADDVASATHLLAIRDELRATTRRLERQKATIESLHDVALAIEDSETPEAVYDHILAAAEEVLEFDLAIVDAVEDSYLVPAARSVALGAEDYYERVPLDAPDNLAATAYRSGDPSLVADLDEREASPASSAYRSALTVPIGAFGVLQTVSVEADAFDEHDLAMAELLVAHARSRLDSLESSRQLEDRTRELERQNERLNEFATLVSHDLRNPLAVAQGRLELASEQFESDDLGRVADALDRMQEIVADLLTLARIGRDTAELESIPLATIVRRCWDHVATADGTLAVETDLVVRADRSRLKQCLENLMRNAVEHGSSGRRLSTDDAVEGGSPSGQPSTGDAVESGGEGVTVTVGTLDDGTGFYLEDDGPGIPLERRQQVFEAGYSGSPSGTGFGLAIVRQVAATHGWELELTEAASGGARFECRGVETA